MFTILIDAFWFIAGFSVAVAVFWGRISGDH